MNNSGNEKRLSRFEVQSILNHKTARIEWLNEVQSLHNSTEALRIAEKVISELIGADWRPKLQAYILKEEEAPSTSNNRIYLDKQALASLYAGSKDKPRYTMPLKRAMEEARKTREQAEELIRCEDGYAQKLTQRKDRNLKVAQAIENLQKEGALDENNSIAPDKLVAMGVKIGWLNQAFVEGCNSRSEVITFDMNKLAELQQKINAELQQTRQI